MQVVYLKLNETFLEAMGFYTASVLRRVVNANATKTTLQKHNHY